MHLISLLNKYSKAETMVDSISHLLMPNRHLSEYELEDLTQICVEVFVCCDQQIPVDLARRLQENKVDLEYFFDVAWKAMLEVDLIDSFTLN